MTNTATPFPSFPKKASVLRLDNGRIAVFIGAAYQETDRATARQLRDDLSVALSMDGPGRPDAAEESALESMLTAEIRERNAR